MRKYSLKKHLAEVVEAIADAAEGAESFEIAISAKANEIPTISFKIDSFEITKYPLTIKKG